MVKGIVVSSKYLVLSDVGIALNTYYLILTTFYYEIFCECLLNVYS